MIMKQQMTKEMFQKQMNNVNQVYKREIASIEATEDERRFELSFSSETPYQRSFGDEILEHSSDSIDLSRLEQIGVVLFNHNPDKVIGKIEKVWIDGSSRKGKAVIFFDDDEQSNIIYKKVKSGTLKGVSVGYVVQIWEVVEENQFSTDGRFQGECYIAKKWQPLEISIVSVPADASVGVGRSVTENTQTENEVKTEVQVDSEQKNSNLGVYTLKNINQENIDGQNMEVNKMDEKELMEQVNKRNAEIIGLGEHYKVNVNEFIKSGASVETVKTHIMEQLAKSQTVTSNVEVTVDETEKFRSAVTDAIALRAGLKIEKPAMGATELRHLNMVELSKEVLERSGESVRGKSAFEIATRAMNTASLQLVFANVTNKVLTNAYQETPTTYQMFSRITTANDFKEMSRVKLSELPDVTKIAEGADYPEVVLGEDAEKYSIDTYGGVVLFTRQAMVNDDLGALLRTPQLLGASLARTVNKSVYDMLGGSHIMSDTKELFSADHKNLLALTLTIQNLSKAKAAMKRQTGLKGAALNIDPAFLVVGPELEFEARQIVASVVDPTKNNAAVNVLYNSVQVIVDANIPDKTWYLLANTNQIDTMEVAFLNGINVPYIEQDIKFENDAIRMKARLDFGAKAIDFRGMVKSTVV